MLPPLSSTMVSSSVNQSNRHQQENTSLSGSLQFGATRRQALILGGLGAATLSLFGIATAPVWWPKVTGNDTLGGSGQPSPPPSTPSPAPEVSHSALPPASESTLSPETIGDIPGADYKLTVDYYHAAPKTHSVSGLLNGFNPWVGGMRDIPSAQDIKQLKPQLWRLGEDQLDSQWLSQRVKPSGAKLEFVVSDSFNYAGQDPNWQAPKGPEFQKKVQQLYQQYGREMPYWDIWNEPDVEYFWKQGEGSYDAFLNTFTEAAQAIRQVDGGQAKIVGPSLGEYDKGKLTQFLDHCVANNIRLDVLSWHDLWAPDTQNNFSVISHHMQEMRELLNQDKYKALGCKEIHVNELVGKDSSEKPGNTIASYYYAELGGSDDSQGGKLAVLPVKGARATWDSQLEGDQVRSYNNTIGGLIKPEKTIGGISNAKGSQTYDGATPVKYYKAPYYAQLSYAEVTPGAELKRPQSTQAEKLPLGKDIENPFNIVALASPDKNKKEILVAYGDTSGTKEPRNIELVISSSDINGHAPKTVTETQIRETPESSDTSNAIYLPSQRKPGEVKQVNGQMAILLNDVQPGELRRVIIE